MSSTVLHELIVRIDVVMVTTPQGRFVVKGTVLTTSTDGRVQRRELTNTSLDAFEDFYRGLTYADAVG